MNIRIGQGVDIHPFTKEKTNLVLGGIEIPHEFGLKGHSDADALTHAICDAMLGALSLGDIGQHFSDQDPEHKNQSSLVFLRHVMGFVQEKGFAIGNIDSTVITEKPILKDYLPNIRKNLSETLRINLDQVSVKATRPEKLGSLGRNEGLMAMVNVLLVAS